MNNNAKNPGPLDKTRAAVLLVRHLFEALGQRRIEIADSEPHWLAPSQYCRRGGGVELLPANATDLMTYASERSFLPLGIVIVNEGGDYWEYFNDDPSAAQDREFALRLFLTHAHFWFGVMPSLKSKSADA
jgi:hypothetical protein